MSFLVFTWSLHLTSTHLDKNARSYSRRKFQKKRISYNTKKQESIPRAHTVVAKTMVDLGHASKRRNTLATLRLRDVGMGQIGAIGVEPRDGKVWLLVANVHGSKQKLIQVFRVLGSKYNTWTCITRPAPDRSKIQPCRGTHIVRVGCLCCMPHKEKVGPHHPDNYKTNPGRAGKNRTRTQTVWVRPWTCKSTPCCTAAGGAT